MPCPYYAHSLEGKPPSEWQPLEEHLRNVAKTTQSSPDGFEIVTQEWPEENVF